MFTYCMSTNKIMASVPEQDGDLYVKNIPNSLLCYVSTHLDSSTKDHLVKTISQYYSIDEILEAKNVLYKVFLVLGEPLKRRSTPSTYEVLLTLKIF